MYYNDWETPTGWRCPVCGRVYSPMQSICLYCNGNSNYIRTTNTNPLPSLDNGWDEYLHQLAKWKEEL